MLYVGGGCLDASEELREFVRHTGIPVASTLKGLGAFPESHELSLGMLGALLANVNASLWCEYDIPPESRSAPCDAVAIMHLSPVVVGHQCQWFVPWQACTGRWLPTML